MALSRGTQQTDDHLIEPLTPCDETEPAAHPAYSAPVNTAPLPLNERKRHERELNRTLQQLGMALQAGAELDETLQAVAELACQILNARSAVIRLLDADGKLVVRAVSGGAAVEQLRDISFTLDEGVIGQVARDLQPRIVNDFDPAEHPFTEAVRNAGIHGLLCVPILTEASRKAMGTLTLHNKQEDGVFTPEDQATLTAFAVHAAVAVEKAMLREEQQEAAYEANILHEVASATSTLNLSSLFRIAVEKVAEVSGVEGCCLFLYNPERSRLRGVEECRESGWCDLSMARSRIPLTQDDPLFQRLQAEVPVDLPDENIASPAQAKLLEVLHGSFHILVPLLNHGHLVGVMALTPHESDPPLTARQCRILISVGRQIASAIENARLFEEAEHRVRELSVLQRISQALASSLHLKEMLDTVLKEVIQVFSGSSGSILLHSPERGTLKIESSHGLSARLPRRIVKSGEGVAGWVAQHRDALRVDNLAGDPRFRLHAPRPEIVSAMIVPLMSKQRLLGVMCVSTDREERRYTDRDLNLMKTMAASISVAIENARLYHEERNIAQIARTALLPSLPLAVAGLDIGEKHRPAREVGGDYYTIFPIEGDRVGILVSDVSGKSVHAAMHAAMGKHFIRALSQRCMCPAEVLRYTNEIIAQETPPEIFISVFFGILHLPTGQLVYANAGHVPPYLVRRDHSVVELNSTGLLLGLWEDSPYAYQETVMNPGDLLLCYTDGVTEARREGQLFGDERLKSCLLKHCEEPAQKLVDAVYRRTVAFCGKKVDDDLALLAVRRV